MAGCGVVRRDCGQAWITKRANLARVIGKEFSTHSQTIDIQCKG